MLTFLNLVPKWVYLAIIAVLIATSCTFKIKNTELELDLANANTKVAVAEKETARVREEHLQLVAESTLNTQRLEQTYRDKERELYEVVEAQRKKAHENTIAIKSQRDSLRLQFSDLQARFASVKAGTSDPAQPATHPSNRQASTGGTATEFSNPIGDLIEEATRADTIRQALIGCYDTYDRVRAEFSAPDKP